MTTPPSDRPPDRPVDRPGDRPGDRPAARGVTRLARNPARGGDEARLTIRVDFGGHGALGPGKIRLLELIGAQGSISAAGRAMGMSYRRAWLLVDSLNQAFRAPVVSTQHGGPGGGGAQLTAAGQALVDRYRAMETALEAAAAQHLAAFAAALSDGPPTLSEPDPDLEDEA
ncbi:winged helix-turn-helix domain-containing protein [Stella sp.]|uniref:winged helix-turn-helix domain-containing protein n=1 Tax=Stella sp. TaxID=2912054 RepID=UPI0035B155EF